MNKAINVAVLAEITVESHNGLRALRLYHWNQCLQNRESAKFQKDIRLNGYFNGVANFHLTQVQLLNEFFEIGDTAERDSAGSFIADAPPG